MRCCLRQIIMGFLASKSKDYQQIWQFLSLSSFVKILLIFFLEQSATSSLRCASSSSFCRIRTISMSLSGQLQLFDLARLSDCIGYFCEQNYPAYNSQPSAHYLRTGDSYFQLRLFSQGEHIPWHQVLVVCILRPQQLQKLLMKQIICSVSVECSQGNLNYRSRNICFTK